MLNLFMVHITKSFIYLRTRVPKINTNVVVGVGFSIYAYCIV